MGAQFAVVRGITSKIILRVIDTTGDQDDRAVVIARRNLQAGEEIIVLNLADHPRRDIETLHTVIGQPVHSGRCVIVDPKTNLVVGVCMADPTLYRPPNGNLLIQHDTAGVGWAHAGGILTEPSA